MLHQVGVSFDLYYDARKHRIKIYKLTTEILNTMNNKVLVGGIFCDLETAFDCVSHDILLSK